MSTAPQCDRIAYGKHDRIRIGMVVYTCVRTTDNGHELERVDKPGMFEFLTHDAMNQIEHSGEYRYDKDWFKPGKVSARERSGVENFADIPKREQSRLLWKNEWVDRFRKMVARGETDRTNDGMTAAIEKIAVDVNQLECAKVVRRTNEKRDKGKPVPLRKDGQPRKIRSGTVIAIREKPSYRTLQRWLSVMEKCDWAPEALRDNYRKCGDRTPRLEPEAQELMVEAAKGYATQARPTRDNQYVELDSAIIERNKTLALEGVSPLTLPSRRRFYAEIKALDAFWVYARRHTLEAARRKFAAVEDGPGATRIGERVEMDEWQVGLQTLLVRSKVWQHLDRETKKAVRRARWYLTVAIDRASRCILAMRLAETPLASEAVATIQMVLTDKSDLSDGACALTRWFMATGIGMLVTDWGSAFRSEETRRVVRALGATFDHPPAGRPHLRGTIERVFSTTETRFLSHFTGRTFSSVVDKGTYKAGEGASIPLDVLARSLVRYVVDDYHHRPHAGLGGETPHNAWVRLVGQTGRLPVPDKHTQRAIFGIETSCKLDNAGVTILGLRYQNRELYEYFTGKSVHDVTVRVDPLDVGFASVKLGDDWLTVPCLKKELRGVSLKAWKAVTADLRSRFKNEASMSRHIVLATVRDLSAIARAYQREAGISEDLDTSESLQRAREELGFGFSLPEWDEPPVEGEDLLDGVIPVPGPAVHVPSETVPLETSPEPPTWRMGGYNEDAP